MGRLNILWIMMLVGCGAVTKIKKLESYERDHYGALQVWMSGAQRTSYLSGETPEARDEWLKSNGLWERFYQYDEVTRKKIVAGEVEVGFTDDQVFMAWGEPHGRTRLVGRSAERSEVLSYRFEVDKQGVIRVWKPKSPTAHNAVERYTLEVIVDDQVVAEINRKDGWE